MNKMKIQGPLLVGLLSFLFVSNPSFARSRQPLGADLYIQVCHDLFNSASSISDFEQYVDQASKVSSLSKSESSNLRLACRAYLVGRAAQAEYDDHHIPRT